MSRQTAHDLDEKWRSNDIALEENVDFSSLMLSDRVLNGLKKAGFKKPSPIQLQAIPLGRCGLDLLVQAKSGTGKTCVFTVIALENLLDVLSTQVLILTPTREIATQIRDVVKEIGSGFEDLKCCAFIGGLPLVDDKKSAHDCQIAVGTPGRIRQLISMEALTTESIRLFVIDEADKLLEESFFADLNWIFSALPENKQVVAASATFPKKLATLITRYMRNPSLVRLNINEICLLGIVQYYCVTNFHPISNVLLKNKFEVLWKILNTVQFSQCLVFCNMITRVESICDDLNAAGFPTASISSYQEQEERLEAIEKLKTFQSRILVTSDLVARGIDAENVDFVINIDLPYDVETYLHRIGRAGRYGSKGIALSLVAENELTSLHKFREQTKLKLYRLPDPVPSNLSNLEPDESQLLPMPSSVVNPPSPEDKIADFTKSNSSESENFLDFLISDQVPKSISETAEPEPKPKATNGEYNNNTCEKVFPHIKYSSSEMRNLRLAADSGCKELKTSEIVTNTENDCSYQEGGDSNSFAENGVLENNVIEMEIDYLHESSDGFVVESNVSQTANSNSNDKLKCLEVLDNDVDLIQTSIILGNCLIENGCKNKFQENSNYFSEQLSFIPKATINEECNGEIDAALNKSKILECDSALNEVASSIFLKSFVLPNLQENDSEFTSTEDEATVCSVIENVECEKHAETNCIKSTRTDLNHSDQEKEQLRNVEPILSESYILPLTFTVASQNVPDTIATSTVSNETKPILSSFEHGVVNYYSQVGEPAEEICDDDKNIKASTVALENLFPICYHEKLSFEDLMISYTNFESLQSEYVVSKDDNKAPSNKINLTAVAHIIDESCKHRQIFFLKASKSLMENGSKQEENSVGEKYAEKSTPETISDSKSTGKPNFSGEPHSDGIEIVNHSTPIRKRKPKSSMASSPESVMFSSKLSTVPSDLSKISFESSEVTPEWSKVTPESSQVAPESSQVAPESSQVAPESSKVAPNLTKTSSESLKVSSELTKISSEFSKSARYPFLSGLSFNEADSNKKSGTHIETSGEKLNLDLSNQPTNGQIAKDASTSTTSSVVPVIKVQNLNSNLKSKPKYAPSSDDEVTHQMMTNYCFDGEEDILDMSNEETMVNECKYDEGKSIFTESEADDTVEYKAKSKKSDKKFLTHEQLKGSKSKYNKSNNKKNSSSKVRKSKNSTKEEQYPATKWLPVTKEHSTAKKSSGSEKSYADNRSNSKECKKYAEKHIETPANRLCRAANNLDVAFPNYYNLTSIPFQHPQYRSYGEHSNVHQNLIPYNANCSRSRQVCCLTIPCIAKFCKNCFANLHNTNCSERVCLCCLEYKMRACCCDKSPKSVYYPSYQWTYLQSMLRFPH